MRNSINKSEWHMQPDCLLCWQLMPCLLLEKSCKHASLVLSSLLLWIASVSCHGLQLLWAGVKRLAVPMPEFTGGGSHCTARMCLSKHLVCFGILQSSNCITVTPLAQLERLSSREAHHCVSLLSIKYQTRERESHEQDFLNLHKGSARISTDVPLNRTTRSPGLRYLS